ncbi:hypothetical protein EV421DRAFT_1906792 [Armillaria borealis]|uniref:Uncharacterized protein n=1 Tax=Armillaria borealis TaxID=47425 RepID=A0AA39ML35_9AGAR|nr:hypothetical protein EV421DRAFT_1906792 [Armillaria borealis]
MMEVRAVISIMIACRQVDWEVGCVRNARSYLHDPLLCVRYEVFTTNDVSRAAEGSFGSTRCISGEQAPEYNSTRGDDVGSAMGDFCEQSALANTLFVDKYIKTGVKAANPALDGCE